MTTVVGPGIHPKIAHLVHPIEDLHQHRLNPRRGDVEQIRASLRKNGQYRPIVVNEGSLTGHPNEILAGNHTWLAAKAEEWQGIACTWVDVDDDAGKRILVVDNRANDLATYDPSVLIDLLESFDGNLDGTLYTEDALAELARNITEPTAAEWAAAMGELPTTDREFATRTFNLRRDQAAIVDEAVAAAIPHLGPDAGNRNAAALVVIAEAYLAGSGER